MSCLFFPSELKKKYKWYFFFFSSLALVIAAFCLFVCFVLFFAVSTPLFMVFLLSRLDS